MQKLDLINKQFRHSYKMLQQKKDYVRKEQRKVGTVKICEPQAIVDVAMKEIDEQSNYRGIHTAYGTRQYSKSNNEKLTRSISAPVRHRANVESSVSLLQMKNIALIDSISEKEKAQRQQKAREELERMSRLQKEALQKKVQEFIERLKEKSQMSSLEESP